MYPFARYRSRRALLKDMQAMKSFVLRVVYGLIAVFLISGSAVC